MLWVVLSMPFSVFGQGDDEDVVALSQDALLVQGIIDGDVAVVERAMAHGARLNQQLNGAGQTPLALAQQRLQEAQQANDGFEEAYRSIVEMLHRAYAPSYVMYTPAYDHEGHIILCLPIEQGLRVFWGSTKEISII